MTRRDRLCAAGIVGLVVASAFAINPLFDHPVYDDWAYAKNVLRFLEEGRLYFVWTQTSFVFQFAVGVLFSKLLGFSFSTLHLSTLVFSIVGLLALYSLLRQTGHRETTSMLLSMAMFTTVFYFHFTFSFMTDVPSVATALLALAAEVKAQRSRAWRWYLASALAFTVALLTRDLIGIAVVGLLLQAGMKRELTPARLMLLLPLAVWAAYLGIGPELIEMPWRQMRFAPVGWLTARHLLPAVLMAYVITAQLALQFGPLLLALWPQAVRRARRHGWRGAVLVGMVLGFVASLAVLQYHNPTEPDDRLMPYRPGFISIYGIYNAAPLLGDRSPIMGTGLRVVLTAVGALGAAQIMLCLVFVGVDTVQRLARSRRARRVVQVAGPAFLCAAAASRTPGLHRVVSETGVWGIWWMGLLAAVAGLTCVLLAILAARAARRGVSLQGSAEEVQSVAWPVYLYCTSAVVYYLVSAKFFIRYAMVLVPGLFVLLRHGLGPLRPSRWLLAPLMALSLLVGIVWTRDQISFNEARWKAGGWLMDRGVPPDLIEGGFEFNGWHLPFGAPPKSPRHEPSPTIPQVSLIPRFLLTLDTFAPPGRGRRTYRGRRYRWLALFPYHSLLENRTRNVVAWGEKQLNLPLRHSRKE
jgi:hypothetical protein